MKKLEPNTAVSSIKEIVDIGMKVRVRTPGDRRDSAYTSTAFSGTIEYLTDNIAGVRTGSGRLETFNLADYYAGEVKIEEGEELV